MEKIEIDISKKYGKFKPLNATNGGPWHNRRTNKMYRSNFIEYKAAKIPYSRNHDLAVHTVYGGPYSHDITCIFPDFNADPYDPASYDFACTDEDILVCLEAGTKTFFRLGQTIEHQIKKHGTIPPKDFKKWAIICEHIIRHYNEGWANGFNLDFEYWEIWNEPDLDEEDSTNKRTWGGTKQEFFDFYEIAAKHLKNCFPDLKIGGPALAFRDEWADDFLKTMSERKVPIDFFSWHIYAKEPNSIANRAQKIKNLLIKHGYENAESILNEWNYVKDWTDNFVYSIEQIRGIKGASFLMACMSEAQGSPIDMMMYYDTRPSVFNGVFDFYTAKPLKGYYPFLWYGMFYDLESEIRAKNSIENIYNLCGVDHKDKVLAVITYYSDNDYAENKMISVDFGKSSSKYQVYLLDDNHSGELVEITDKLEFEMKVHSAILIKEL